MEKPSSPMKAITSSIATSAASPIRRRCRLNSAISPASLNTVFSSIAPASSSSLTATKSPNSTAAQNKTSRNEVPARRTTCCALRKRPPSVHSAPTRIRIERAHPPCDFRRIRAEIFLIYDALTAHDKALHSRRSILRRIRHKREPTRQLSVDDIAHRAAVPSRALRRQHAKQVAVKWLSAPGFRSVRAGQQGPNGIACARRAVFRKQTLVFRRITRDRRRILTRLSVREILPLRFDQLSASENRRHLVLADSPIKHLILGRCDIERPRTVLLHEW